MTAFLLSSAVATPIAGRLGDMFGKRRVLVAVLADRLRRDAAVHDRVAAGADRRPDRPGRQRRRAAAGLRDRPRRAAARRAIGARDRADRVAARRRRRPRRDHRRRARRAPVLHVDVLGPAAGVRRRRLGRPPRRAATPARDRAGADRLDRRRARLQRPGDAAADDHAGGPLGLRLDGDAGSGSAPPPRCSARGRGRRCATPSRCWTCA